MANGLLLFFSPILLSGAFACAAAEACMMHWKDLRGSGSHDRHDGHDQLEVPTPIEEDGERSLFA